MSAGFVLAAVLAAVVALLVLDRRNLRARLLAAYADRDRLDATVRNNLRAIRARVDYGFPEACAVCDALEAALHARGRVSLDNLEFRLTALRRAHNAALLDAAGAKEKRLEFALRDVLACFNEKPLTITGERVEAWRSAL